MDIQQRKFLAEGRVSRVYLLKEGQVLKLLHPSVPREKVEDEYRRCRIISQAGIRAPRVLDLVEAEGRYGILFEWAGKTDLLKAKLGNPLNVPSCGRFMAKAHLGFLACETNALPDIKQEACRMSRHLPEGLIPPDQFVKLDNYLDRLPTGNTVCHMDFHPGNIMLGEGYHDYRVIDWSEALKGPPDADIAMTSLILSMAETSPGTRGLLRMLIPIFRKMFEQYYRTSILKSNPAITQESIAKWTLVAAIFRMHLWQIDSEQRFLTHLIQKELTKI